MKSFRLYASVENFVKNGPAGSRAVNLIEKLENFLSIYLYATFIVRRRGIVID